MNKVRVIADAKEMTNSKVQCRSVTLREKILRKLLGDLHKVTVIVPGENVHMEIMTGKKREDGYEAV